MKNHLRLFEVIFHCVFQVTGISASLMGSKARTKMHSEMLHRSAELSQKRNFTDDDHAAFTAWSGLLAASRKEAIDGDDNDRADQRHDDAGDINAAHQVYTKQKAG